jgi:trehalose-6-phosphate synthase
MAHETLYTKGNSKKTELKDEAEEDSNLRLMWIPSHMGITGNERADKAATDALDQNGGTKIKVVRSDYCKWVKQEEVAERMEDLHKQYGHNKTTCCVDRYNSTEGLPRRQQVAVSRLRMGYTNITHGYKIRDELKPHCEECDHEVTIKQLIWQCAAYNS